MDKILITGGAGFIGSTLANQLCLTNELVIVDDLSMGSKSNLPQTDTITFIEGCVTDKVLMTQVLSENNFDYIYHLAAVASVADSVERPLETHEINFDSVFSLLELTKKYQSGLKRLIFASSAAVYGDEPTLPKAEESVIKPLTPYAIDKFAAEKYVLAYSNLYNVPTSAVRFFNVYGPKQNPNSPYSGVISIILDRLKRKQAGEDCSFTMFGSGKQSRDFVYIEDVLLALRLVATSKESLGEVYNVATGVETTLNELVEILSELLAIELPIDYQESREGDIEHSLADIHKIKGLGFNPEYSVKAGLTDCIKRGFA
ncbi:NAD-dependent epimerase/dehydratase family protein [Vagococcus sp. BWB3-3]|uniref:NAD-dependent epimerase/dehydratase family protein n=1 Tax=Vagococcus allomyrinae TaxID=2794353 RepID=A0A940PIR8_9ENTE|nr:NAD-dependent epimerase/dehydratase family protein [Vagococcus allomyrinae]MBP1043658.1 NAD-dependent epimerase/dehydratase family protein [Vagococcus allomyrinae]